MATINSNGTGGGNWSAGASWSGGVAPGDGDKAIIVSGDTITVDGTIVAGDESSTAIDIQDGVLKASRSANTSLTCSGTIRVTTSGFMDWGTEGDEIPNGYTAELVLNKKASPSWAYGIVIDSNRSAGSLFGFSAYGDDSRTRVTSITGDVTTSNDTCTLAEASHGWVAGDEVLICSSNPSLTDSEREYLTVASVSGADITFTTNFSYGHLAGCYIGNLTSNVTVRPYNTGSTTRSGIQTGQYALIAASHVRFEDLGRATNYGFLRSNPVQNYNTFNVLVGCVFDETAGESRSSFSVFYVVSADISDCVFAKEMCGYGMGGYHLLVKNSIITPTCDSAPSSRWEDCWFDAIGTDNGGKGTFDRCVWSGKIQYIQRPSDSQSSVFRDCDIGYTHGLVDQYNDYFSRYASVSNYAGSYYVKNSLINSRYQIPELDADLANQLDLYCEYKQVNNDPDVNFAYTHKAKRETDTTTRLRSNASLKVSPYDSANVYGVDEEISFDVLCAAGDTINIVGYVQVDSAFYNSGDWTAPTVTISGLGITPVVHTVTSAAAGAWEKFDVSATNDVAGYDGNLVVTFTTNRKSTSNSGSVYFDGVPFSPFVSKCRHYGYVFDDTNPVRTINPYVSASEATAATYASDITIVGTTSDTGTITISGAVTPQEVYDYCQYWACQPANFDYKVPFTTTDGRNFSCGSGYRIVVDATGELTVNPELYTLVAEADGPRPFISYAGEITLGVKTGSVYTSGVAIRDNYAMDDTNYWKTVLYGTLQATADGSTFNAYGATIETKSSLSIGGSMGPGSSKYVATIDVEKLTVKNIGSYDMQCRFDNNTGSTVTISGLVLDGSTNPMLVLFANDYDSFSAQFLRAQLQSYANQPSDLEFTTLQFEDNADPTDVLLVGSYLSSDDVTTITDSDVGMDIVVGYDTTNYRGALAMQSTLNMTLLDITGSPITSAKYYLADTDDGNRADPSGRGDVDWISDRTYQDSFDGSGQASDTILIGTVTNTSTTPPVVGYSYRSISGDSTDDFKYITTAYGYLPTVNNVVLKGYEQVSVTSRAIEDTGITESTRATVAAYTGFAWDAYTTTVSSDHSLQELYDWTKWLESEYPVVVATNSDTPEIASSDGSTFSPHSIYKINLQANLTGTSTLSGGTLEIDTGGDFADTVTLNGTTLDFQNTGTYDYRSKSLAGTINLVNSSGGAVTVQLDPSVTYTNTGPNITVGASLAVQITAANLVDGTRVQIYNVTQAAELDNSVVSGGAGYSYNATLGVGEEVEDGDTIRLRATYQSGTAAKMPVLASGVCSTGGLGFVDTQSDDTVYATYGLDGSTITKFDADYGDTEIDLIVGSNFAAAEAYAWYCYILTTEQGVRNFFGAVTPEDEANLKINTSLVDLMWDNDTSSNVYQTDNIRMYRDDGAYPVKDPTTGGGGIDIVWRSKVYGYATSSGITTADKNEIINGVTGSSAITAIKAKTDDLTFTVPNELDVNVQSLNDTALQGTGAEGDKWRG